jgi:hypothetical protein
VLCLWISLPLSALCYCFIARGICAAVAHLTESRQHGGCVGGGQADGLQGERQLHLHRSEAGQPVRVLAPFLGVHQVVHSLREGLG